MLKKEDALLTGKGASKGKIIGTCRIVNGDEEKMAKLVKGEIMVSDRTAPKDIIYMRKASAFITNKGGRTSHTGIVAREWGIPAVVGTVEATTKLKDGQKVFLDGEKGLVYDYVPGMEKELEEKPKPTAGPSLADNMAAVAEKRGFSLPPGFMEKMKRRE